MSGDQAKALAHELALEYIKNTNFFEDSDPNNIPQIVDKFADINKRFYDAIKFHKIIDQLY